ncbi:MAG: rhodanese-like domain-containing protein [Planctomycetales bacterium]
MIPRNGESGLTRADAIPVRIPGVRFPFLALSRLGGLDYNITGLPGGFGVRACSIGLHKQPSRPREQGVFLPWRNPAGKRTTFSAGVVPLENQGKVQMEIDVRAVKAKLDAQEDFLLLDCREAEEHQLTNIEGALLLPMSEIANRVAELETHRDREIVVYCHHGMRSLDVARWLASQGFADVHSMTGGVDQWSVEIDPSKPRY